jgi:hypothetical protein
MTGNVHGGGRSAHTPLLDRVLLTAERRSVASNLGPTADRTYTAALAAGDGDPDVLTKQRHARQEVDNRIRERAGAGAGWSAAQRKRASARAIATATLLDTGPGRRRHADLLDQR